MNTATVKVDIDNEKGYQYCNVDADSTGDVTLLAGF